MKRIFYVLGVLALFGCTKKDAIVVGGNGNETVISVDFAESTYEFDEASLDNMVRLNFSAPVSVNSTVVIRVMKSVVFTTKIIRPLLTFLEIP